MITPETIRGPRPARAGSCTLSVIVPAFNEEAVLRAFHARLLASIADTKGGFEILYVDDGSTDGTFAILEQFRSAEPRCGIIRLSRNFGKEQAMSAGLRHARGAATVIIDADLQDPPELIPGMLRTWGEGVEVVNMRRRHRDGESWLKRTTARAFYRIINWMSTVPIPEDVGDFRLLDRRAVDALNRLPEHNRFLKGLVSWIGYEQRTIDYDRAQRSGSKSRWHYWGLWNLAVDAITGFSVTPLKIASFAGFLAALGAFAYATYFVAKTLLFGEPVSGFPTLIVTILILGGLQLMATGMLGEYLGRLYAESKRRPPYFVQDYRAPGPAERSPGPLAEEDRDSAATARID